MDDKYKKIINSYREKADEIIMKMFNVLARAHRKIDDLKYRQTLEKLQKVIS